MKLKRREILGDRRMDHQQLWSNIVLQYGVLFCPLGEYKSIILCLLLVSCFPFGAEQVVYSGFLELFL